MGNNHNSTEEATSILSTILSDVNAILPNFFTLAEGYRLLVGAAEEIRQMNEAPFEIFERAIIRCDRTGTLIDVLLELLCCKIKFSSEFLSVTCAPVDIIRQLSDCCDQEAHRTAENILLIEAMRRLLENIDKHGSCFCPPPPMKPKPSPPAPPAKTKTKSGVFAQQEYFPSDFIPGKELATEASVDVETEPQADLTTEADFAYLSDRSPHQENGSPLSRRHI